MSRFRGLTCPALFIGPNTTPEEREAQHAEQDRIRAVNERAAEERRKLAAPVIESLADVSPETLEIAGRALELDRGPLAGVGRAFLVLAVGKRSYAESVLSGHLLELAGDDELVELLGYADEPPWPALAVALETIRAEDSRGAVREVRYARAEGPGGVRARERGATRVR